MSDHPQIFHIANSAHRSVFELLPWYVNGSLSTNETSRVADHLEVCLRCQHEVAQLSRLKNIICADDDALSLEPAVMHAHSLVDAYEGKQNSIQGWGWTTIRSLWQRPTRMGAALAMSLVSAVVVTLMLLKFDLPPNAEFTTLTSATSTSPAYELTIVFEAQATHASVRKLLIDIQAEIVRGPSDHAELVVAVLQPNADKVVAILHNSPIVNAFATPELVPPQ